MQKTVYFWISAERLLFRAEILRLGLFPEIDPFWRVWASLTYRAEFALYFHSLNSLFLPGWRHRAVHSRS